MLKNVRNLVAAACLSLTLTLNPATQCFGASLSAPAGDPWWKHAIIYEIYPRSFADSNGDGIGDLNGITSKLDYLHDLGVDAIWLTPCYPSPQVDFGYDVSDYCNIAPEYGTLADFDRLVDEAKKRNIRIIMDLVVNHTSDKHQWFVQSRSSKDNPKRDWYIWRDPSKTGGPPNNWQSIFGHSCWTLDPKTNQYYYHFFYPEQPDINWRNPQLRKAMYDVARFWLDRGVAGFRLDAVGCLFEDPGLHDNPYLEGTNKFGDRNMENKYNDHLEQVHEVMRELRAVLNAYPGDRVLVGETSGENISDLSTMFGRNLDEIQLPMNFFFAYLNKLSAKEFEQKIGEWDSNPAKGWPVYLFSNHDSTRHYIRYGDGKHNDAIAKLTGGMLLTLRGTPLMYYGEELGMENNDPTRVEDVYDPIGKIGWPKEKGRDGERTPMQWDGSKFAGFTSGKPWLLPPVSYASHNVKTELDDPESVLNFYKSMIKLRRNVDALRNGNYAAVDSGSDNVLAYLRSSNEDAVMVAINMSDHPVTFSPKLNGANVSMKEARTLISSTTDGATDVGATTLEPFEIRMWSLPKVIGQTPTVSK